MQKWGRCTCTCLSVVTSDEYRIGSGVDGSGTGTRQENWALPKFKCASFPLGHQNQPFLLHAFLFAKLHGVTSLNPGKRAPGTDWIGARLDGGA